MSTSHRDAFTCLKQVLLADRSLTDVLAESDYDGLCRAISFGVCRYFYPLHAMATDYLTKPFKEKDNDILLAILMGLFQLDHMNVPPHVVLNETVKLAQAAKKPWAKNVINAVLRAHQRRTTPFDFSQDDEARTSHPTWFIDAVRESWPEQAEAILAANNEKAPMTLRVNTQRITVEQYAADLTNANIAFSRVEGAPMAIVLEEPCAVINLPGFHEGHFSVQDISAQLAAPLLACEVGQTVLDACAAPGGKTCHLLELTPNLTVHAVDHSAERLTRVSENTQRLGLTAMTHCLDAMLLGDTFAPAEFDRILLDAPCSATGVIRRHPDIKLLRQPEDIVSLSQTQSSMLQAMWPLLKPGGRLLYATCSVLKMENDDVIAAFLAKEPQAVIEPIALSAGIKTPYGWQLLPTPGAMDGFYYAVLCKAV